MKTLTKYLQNLNRKIRNKHGIELTPAECQEKMAQIIETTRKRDKRFSNLSNREIIILLQLSGVNNKK